MEYILSFCLITLGIKAQVSIEPTFRNEANNIPGSEYAFITVNIEESGNQQPDGISLIDTSGNYWEKQHYCRPA